MQPIGTDIWHLPGRPLHMPGRVVMPIASTVIRLPTGGVVVYSPIEIDDATAAEIEAIGPVEHLIVPSGLHHLYAVAAAARWPNARVHAAPAARAKQPGLRADRSLGGGLDPAWRGALEVEHIDGAPGIDEHVVFHRPSGTLICADLVFHITRPANFASRLLFAMMGVGAGRLAQSRAWWFLRKDRAAARASVGRILAWPIKQVSPCHGEPCPVTSVELATRMTRLAGRAAVPALAAASGQGQG
jgi:hypothetical protein